MNLKNLINYALFFKIKILLKTSAEKLGLQKNNSYN